MQKKNRGKWKKKDKKKRGKVGKNTKKEKKTRNALL
jgi:hypothetical protein